MQLQTNFLTMKSLNGFQNMPLSPDANHNSYHVQNVNANLLKSQFTLNGLQSRFQGNNLNDNKFRTQNSLQASDANTTNGFNNNNNNNNNNYVIIIIIIIIMHSMYHVCMPCYASGIPITVFLQLCISE